MFVCPSVRLVNFVFCYSVIAWAIWISTQPLSVAQFSTFCMIFPLNCSYNCVVADFSIYAEVPFNRHYNRSVANFLSNDRQTRPFMSATPSPFMTVSPAFSCHICNRIHLLTLDLSADVHRSLDDEGPWKLFRFLVAISVATKSLIWIFFMVIKKIVQAQFPLELCRLTAVH